MESEGNQVHWVVGSNRVCWFGGGLKCRRGKKMMFLEKTNRTSVIGQHNNQLVAKEVIANRIALHQRK